MTQEEILQYNKRCAEFLGWDYSEERDRWNEDMLHQYSFVESIELKFHSDWNWIMEVVEAIEKLDSFYVQIEESACYIYDISKFTDEQCNPFISCDLRLNSKKEPVVQAINQFLIWYEQESFIEYTNTNDCTSMIYNSKEEPKQETLEEFVFKVPHNYNIKPKEVIDMCMKEQENIILTWRLGHFVDMINSLPNDTEKNRILKSVFNNRQGELLLESYKSMKSHYEK